MASTRVVLPWSTWAMIAMFLRFSIVFLLCDVKFFFRIIRYYTVAGVCV
jgi:hypothetical protein